MKEDIINFIDDFTIELNPKVQKKITDIHINKKNKIFVTYLPESDEKEILSAVEFVDTKGFTPIVHLPARTMRDINHVEDRKKIVNQCAECDIFINIRKNNRLMRNYLFCKFENFLGIHF